MSGHENDSIPSPTTTVVVTPDMWGSDYPVEPGESVEVVNEVGAKFWLHLVGSTRMGVLSAIQAEQDALRAERDAAIREVSRLASKLGHAESYLRTLADRLDYLQNLWGAEGVTNSTIQALRKVLSELESDAKGDTDE